MSTNDFLPYATGGGANVESQATYVADPLTRTGFANDTVLPAVKYNKISRQANFVASAIAQFIVNELAVDVLDDGNQSGFITKFIDALIATTSGAAGLPVGTVIQYAANAVPTNYLNCDGSSLSTTTYAGLFAVIGYTYGGSGASFNLPYLLGVFVRGYGGSLGFDPGRTFGSRQLDDFKSHTHQVGFSNTNSATNFPGHGDNQAGGSATTTATGGTETRPVNVAMLMCIKYQ